MMMDRGWSPSWGRQNRGAEKAAANVRSWATAALSMAQRSTTARPGQGFSESVLVEAIETDCKDQQCGAETVLMFVDDESSEKVKIVKDLESVAQEDVVFATERLVAEMAEPSFNVAVETPMGDTVKIETQARCTIRDIKAAVAAQCPGLPAERIELQHLGHRLVDTQTAASAGLRAGSVLGHGVGAAYFWQGDGTLPISMELHSKNRRRLLELFTPGPMNPDVPPNAHIILQAGESQTRYDSDHEPLFRQESFFHWAFGVAEPDCYGMIDIDRQTSVLFVPRLPEEYAVWMGEIHPPKHFKEKYDVDVCMYTDEIDSYLQEAEHRGDTNAAGGTQAMLYTLHGMNTDSSSYAVPATFPGIEKYRIDNGRLFPLIVELRVFKTDEEIEVLRYVADVTCKAHMEVMRQCTAGLREYQCEALFQQYVYFHGGCRNCAYTCICASGGNGAVLHYGHAGAPNSKLIKNGDMCLYDMGAEYHCYCSDITSSFPANDNAVLAAVRAVENEMRPGVYWADMHRLAWRVMMEHLLAMEVLQGDLDDLIEAGVPELFMACGLGHFIGVDTHDVGGYPRGVLRLNEPGISALRTTRCLEERMVLTVEPGIYFNGYQMDKGLSDCRQAKFLNKSRIDSLRDFGGVRIEDMVVVTSNGIKQLTTIGRDVETVEKMCQGLIVAPGAAGTTSSIEPEMHALLFGLCKFAKELKSNMVYLGVSPALQGGNRL